MKPKETKCPICGTKNDEGAESCKMCKTILSKKENGKTKVKAPKSRGKTITIIDIEDPLTRKKLEELTLIPGVSRKKALLLYQSGIHSIEEFLLKAFHGEKLSTNYTRTVANKLLIKSLKGKKKNVEIPCPSCNAPNPIDAERCKVCNFDIKEEMDSVNISHISGKMDDTVKGIITDLNESEDFEALPEDMKAEFATAVGSDDIDLDMEKPADIDDLGIDLDTEESPQSHEPGNAKVVEEVPIELSPESEDKIPEEQSQEEPKPAIQKETKPAAEEAAKPEKQDRAADAKQEKVRKVLVEKMNQWKKAGYDVTGLELCLDDVETFKGKAKEILALGKVVKTRCAKQLEMWKAKGFDVSELEPLLETDVAEFMEKAKDILKKQKKQ